MRASDMAHGETGETNRRGGRWQRWVGWGTGAAGKTVAREPQGGSTCTDREGASMAQRAP